MVASVVVMKCEKLFVMKYEVGSRNVNTRYHDGYVEVEVILRYLWA